MLTPTQKPSGKQPGPRRGLPVQMKHQTGLTLVETMIALAISLIVVAAMVALMANSLGSTNRIIGMILLTDELRNSMSMMSRDVRRANYSANAAYCYGNPDCATDGSATQVGDISINNSNDCFTFELDRGWDGNAGNDMPGGFRRATSNAIGVIEMWVGDAVPNCAAAVSDSDDWIEVTDPNEVDITTFSVTAGQSFTGTAELSGVTITQRVRQIRLVIEGELILDDAIRRRIEDIIRVRNDILL